MQFYTEDQLQNNPFAPFTYVAQTGDSAEITFNGLNIEIRAKNNALNSVKQNKGIIVGDPEDLVNIDLAQNPNIFFPK